MCFLRFLVSSQISLKMWFVASMVTLLSLTVTIIVLVISSFSNSVGSSVVSWSRLISVNDFPICFSKSLDNAKPGGVRNNPFEVFCALSLGMSSRFGRVSGPFAGMKMRLDWGSFSSFGGKYTALLLNAVMSNISSKFFASEDDAAVNSSSFTYLDGMISSSRAPHRVRPSPTKAATYES